MTHVWMLSGDGKKAFKNYTPCSRKANEQKSKYEENLPLPETWFYLGPVIAVLQLIRMDWCSLGRELHYLYSQAGSLQVIVNHTLRN